MYIITLQHKQIQEKRCLKANTEKTNIQYYVNPKQQAKASYKTRSTDYIDTIISTGNFHDVTYGNIRSTRAL